MRTSHTSSIKLTVWFLLVFTAEAEIRAQHHVRLNTGVFLAEINTSSLQPTFLDIEFADRVVQLPAWGNMESVKFISTRAIRKHLGVQASISWNSEWLALDYIPCNMIRRVRSYQ